jgi:signal transduction histidine kinase
MAGPYHNKEYNRYPIQKDQTQSPPVIKENRSGQTEQNLIQATENSLLAQLAHLSPDLFFILDHSLSNTVYVNPAASQHLNLGNKQEQVLKTSFLSYMIDEDLLKLRKILQDHRKGETEVCFVDAKNKPQYFKLHFTAHLPDQPGIKNAWLFHAHKITKSTSAPKPIQDHNPKIQKALDAANLGIWSYNLKTQRLECDKQTAYLFGFQPEDLSGSLSQLFHRIDPDDRAHVELAANNAFKNRQSFNLDFRISLPDQPSCRHIAVIGKFMPDEHEDELKITGTCLDISTTRIGDNKNKTNEAFLDESQRIAKIGCFDWNLLLDKITLTSQLYSILDMEKEDGFSLEKFYAKIHPDDLQNVQQTVMDTIRKGGQFNKEFRINTNSRKTKILWAQGQATKDKEHYTTQIIGAIQDITEKKEKDKEINTQHLIIKSMLANLPVIILIVDKYGIVKSLLGSGLDRIGMNENQTIGQSIFEQYPAIGKYIRRVLQGETVSFTEELEIDNDRLHFLSYYFYDHERELAIGFSIDITTQKQTQQAFEQISAKNLELERMNQLMDMFVYAVAHDLKNPINNLDLISMLIQESSSPSEQNEYLQALQKSVFRLKQTIHGLMEVVEIESSRDLNSKVLTFSDVLEQVTEDLQPLLQQKNVVLKTDFLQKRIRYNEAFLTSILKNLISNAIKYSSSKRTPSIGVKTEKTQGYIKLIVSDNGIGIDLKKQGHKLFQPFKRISRQPEGSGIGLYLIKSMIEKNGGRIEVKSTPGKGTTITCYLIPFHI